MEPEFGMRCLYPWTQAYVSAQGIVRPCCSNIELGNIADQTIEDVLFNANTVGLRSAMAVRDDSRLPGDCVGCYELAKQGDHHQFDILYPLGAVTVEEGLATLRVQGFDAFADNYERVRAAYVAGVEPERGVQPLGVWCQVGERCNIRCIMCWEDHDNPADLTRDQIEQVRRMIPTAHSLQITGGEPTVYGDFWRMVDDFREHAPPIARLSFLTNGLNLKKKLRHFEGIKNVTFCINIDGPTRESHEKIRFQSNWDRLIENIQAVYDHKQRHGLDGWGIVNAFTLMRSNIDLLPLTFDLADRFEACWICQLIGGDYQPVAQCRTFFEENIFRFDHLGYSTEELAQKLDAMVPRARALRTSPDLAVSCVEATSARIRAGRQIKVPPATAARLRAIADDDELSREIRALVTAADAPVPRTVWRLQLAVKEAERTSGVDSLEAAEALIALGRRHVSDQALVEAASAFERALGALLAYRAASDELCITVAAELGACLLYTGRLADAERHLRSAHDLTSSRNGSTHTKAADSGVALAKVLLERNGETEAEMLCQHSAGVYRKVYGTENAYYAQAITLRARSFYKLGRPDRAEMLLSQSSALYGRLFGDDHYTTKDAGDLLALCRTHDNPATADVDLPNVRKKSIGVTLSISIGTPQQANAGAA